MTVTQLPSFISKTPDAPARRGEAITPSDTVDQAGGPFRAIFVGTTGTVVVVWDNDTTSTHVNLPSGYVLRTSGKRVNATGTTATNLVAWY